jgi:hypothetical protein
MGWNRDHSLPFYGWFDGSSIPLETKVKQGAKAYEMKFGRRPNICQVHTSQLPAETMVQDVRVVPTTGLLPFDFYFAWIDPEQPRLL